MSDSNSVNLRSNVPQWKELQARGYFDNHPMSRGVKYAGGEESVEAVRRFVPLDKSMTMVVVGCGYGRESVGLSREVGHIFGIDVSWHLLDQTVAFLAQNGVSNFTPVAVDDYKTAIPEGVDLIFSIVVMQHLTRDLVRDYFTALPGKLRPGGSMVIQFLEDLAEGADQRDAELLVHEPSVSWTIPQIVRLEGAAGLTFQEVWTRRVTPTALWHWSHFKRP